MRRKLKQTGSLFLHCDPTASHYIKIILDGVFGHDNFINEIIWSYKTGGASKRYFSKKHDVIFFYAKTNLYNFYPQKEKSYTKSKNRKAGVINYGQGFAEFFQDDNGVYNFVNMRDVWDIPYINSMAKERLGYPTQKPIALLERIIKATTKEDDIVLDPFCGCGTTLDAAQGLKRKWLGIDICMLSTNLIEERLKNKYKFIKYEVDGIPITMEQVKTLIEKSDKSKNEGRYQFQYWAIEKVQGFASTKKSGDGGIDGAIYFYKDEKKNLGKMILSVKSNKKLQASFVRDLIGTMENNKADMAGLISYAPPTPDMLMEIRKAGYFKLKYGLDFESEYPRVQILTAEEILNGKTFNLPYSHLLKKS